MFVYGSHGADVKVVLEECASGGIRLIVTPLDEFATLSVERSSVVLSVWREGASVIRGSVRHEGSGAAAYFQGNQALMQIAEALNLRLETDVRRPR